jgi:hypothetical protein
MFGSQEKHEVDNFHDNLVKMEHRDAQTYSQNCNISVRKVCMRKVETTQSKLELE